VHLRHSCARLLRPRPPQEARAILDGILWKIRTGAAWYDLPAIYPSHQTCYRYCCAWNKSGLINAVISTLLKDLFVRGGLDIKSAMDQGDIRIFSVAGKTKIQFAPHLLDTWQASTALLVLQLAAKKIGKTSKHPRLRLSRLIPVSALEE